MKKLIITIIGVFLFFCIVPFLFSGDRKFQGDKLMDFLKEIRWGLGKDEVQGLFRGKQSMGPHPTQNAIGFFDSSYGVATSIVFYFNRGLFGRDKLARVVVNFFEERPEDEIIEKTYTQIKSDLITQYGRPTREFEDAKESLPEFRQSEIIVWVVGDSILTLSLGLKRDSVPEDLSGIFIGYGDAKKDFISKQWNWLKK
jgi:hypothetical protein